MSRVHGPQPLGWMPPDNENWQYVDILGIQSGRNRSFSPLSTSSHFDADQDFSHTAGHNSSPRHHEPDRVARPRNKFIIFRCEYSRIHGGKAPHVRRPPGTSKGPTISRRASEAWKQMSNEEKEPYKIRAEEERLNHARKYPGYRFRPHRRSSSSAQSCNLQPGTNVTFPYPGTTHSNDNNDVSTPFASSGHAVSYSSTSVQSPPDLSLKKRSVSVSGWTPSLACHTSGVGQDFIEPATKQSFVIPELNYSSFDTPAMLSDWDNSLVSMPIVKSLQLNLGHIQSTSTLSSVNFPHFEHSSTQHQPYLDTDTAWPLHIPAEFPVPSSTQVWDATNSYGVFTTPLQPITISSYTTLPDTVL